MQGAVREGDEGLVLQLELAVAHGGAQRGGEQVLVRAVLAAGGVEQGPPAPALGLGPAERGGDGAQQLGGARLAGAQLGDSGGGGDGEAAPGDVVRLAQFAQHRRGQLGELTGARRLADEERELVAAEPGEYRGLAVRGREERGEAGEARGHRAEQVIADEVAVGGVDVPEAVEAEDAEADAAPAAAQPVLLQRVREAVEKMGAAREPGERILPFGRAQAGSEVVAEARVADREEGAAHGREVVEAQLGPGLAAPG
ncbi:hypothetical protein GA0115246_100627 [Streptomyces sp. SolWspMP-sol7th]|nr:hypothetical protein GA0115246_100627 [Streptomyces sp. SolWspMP-sol7th]